MRTPCSKLSSLRLSAERLSDRVSATAAAFRADRRGSMASLFAIASAGVFLSIGASIDYGQALSVRSTMTGAVDAASLAAARLVAAGETDLAKIEKAARHAYDANFTANGTFGFQVESFVTTADIKTSTVTVAATGAMPTSFMGLAGFDELPIGITSTSTIDGTEIEVAMMLDLTGSMGEKTSDGTGRKIDVLEKAAKSLVETLLPTTGAKNEVRIGLAPFSGAVNAGTLATAVSAGKSTKCVLERVSGTMATDASPVAVPFKKSSHCPGRAVLPLTGDRTTLLTQLNKLPVDSVTAGHLGTAWSYGLLSPTWSPVLPAAAQPKPYGATSVKKIAILMTDGLYNTWGGDISSGDDIKSQAAAVETCQAMRSSGITVYTVGFELTDAAAKKTLMDCASTENGKPLFFDAKNGAELLAAYKAIAERILTLRLSV
ncbi:vWA domain-containing protein [Mongoliimonas terrestris]|uniref:vWA domain-containing protein n=1 Tax=Mongoliimonas terrestris TaxID=1709001 RepID=UPI000949610C|nr:pilus assembly protein TadG-related protein [Mongoliimonas terrestris]